MRRVSKIGSFLWHVMYNKFLELDLLGNTFIVGLANDAIIVRTADTAEKLEIMAGTGLITDAYR